MCLRHIIGLYDNRHTVGIIPLLADIQQYSPGKRSLNTKYPSLPVTQKAFPGEIETFTISTGSPVVLSDTMPTTLPVAARSSFFEPQLVKNTMKAIVPSSKHIFFITRYFLFFQPYRTNPSLISSIISILEAIIKTETKHKKELNSFMFNNLYLFPILLY